MKSDGNPVISINLFFSANYLVDDMDIPVLSPTPSFNNVILTFYSENQKKWLIATMNREGATNYRWKDAWEGKTQLTIKRSNYLQFTVPAKLLPCNDI